MLLCLLLVMGIQGMVMTRDLFNLFVFLEIVSIATYGLLSLQDTSAALSATFKYLMATVLASTFFLIGTMLLYAVTGLLNIDDLIANRQSITGPIGFAALMFLLACLLLELKSFPANGWGLDVYETARGSVAALISGGVSAGVFFALLKLLPLFKDQLEVIAALGAVTFVFSNAIGLRQTKAQRLLGYSSIGQMGLLIIAAALLQQLDASDAVFLVVGGLFVNHLFAKVGLFWLAGYIGKERLQDWSLPVGRPWVIFVFGILLGAVCGFPPFPGFWAKWQLARSAAQALLAGAQPDLMILDINMPEVSGLDLLEFLRRRKEWKNLPIVMLSSEATDVMVDRALSMGADAYVTKPVMIEELEKAMAIAFYKHALV